MRIHASEWLGLLLVLTCVACSKDIVSGKRFACTPGPDGDRSCGSGCTCLAAPPGSEYPGYCLCGKKKCSSIQDCDPTKEVCSPEGFCVLRECDSKTPCADSTKECKNGVCVPKAIPDVPDGVGPGDVPTTETQTDNG